MKKELLRTSLRNLVAITVLQLTLANLNAQPALPDLIVDGVVKSLTTSRQYGTVVVKNGGTLIIKGRLNASQIYLVTGGTLSTTGDIVSGRITIDGSLTAGGNISCVLLSVISGTSTALGASNRADEMQIGGTGRLIALGRWRVDNLTLSETGMLQVREIDKTIRQSGTIAITASKKVVIGSKAWITGHGAGNDPRGSGHDWYANASGGGHAGNGGRGYWSSSWGENVGQGFGSPHTFDAFMGGAGGALGGAGILIEAGKSFELDGLIHANGRHGIEIGQATGGGAGGGITISSPDVSINGFITANGGNGGRDSGGGSGGRIKIFYSTLNAPNLSSNISAKAGKAGGAQNTKDGAVGTIYLDHVPHVINVENAVSVISPFPTTDFEFKFTLEDLSEEVDGHRDSLTPKIELSEDNFQTVAYTFDQGVSLSGWSKPVYYAGDTVSFKTPFALPKDKTFLWRASAKDQSVFGPWTTPRVLRASDSSPEKPEPYLEISRTGTISIYAPIGRTYVLERSDLEGPAWWIPSQQVTIQSKPEQIVDPNFPSIHPSFPATFYRLRDIASWEDQFLTPP